MMSLFKFETISGHVARFLRDAAGMYVAECECACGKTLVTIRSQHCHTESRALESLRDLVYSEHSFIVMNRDGWKCVFCGRSGGLQIDHIVSRAHGRDDRCSNLRSLCCGDHEQRHREPVSAERTNLNA